MQTIQQQNSEQAKMLFESEGKKEKHHQTIIDVLTRFEGTLTNYGISQYCNLSYHQIARRTKELNDLERIESVCKLIDKDGAKRTGYRLLK